MIKNSILYVMLIFVAANSLYVNAATITTITARVTSQKDDAEENTATGVVNYRSSDLELVDKIDHNQLVAVRFQLNVAQGTEITNSFIQFTVDETSTGDANLVIHGEDSAEAAPFSGRTGDLSDRAHTFASVAWSPPSWDFAGDKNVAQQTPDISAILQEIVDGSNWQQGNYVVLLISGTGVRTAESYDGTSSWAPQLSVSYADPDADPAVTKAVDTDTDPAVTKTVDPDPIPSPLYFVDRNHPNASDSNTGTEDQPWRTFVHAAAVVVAGDTVYVKKGVYKDGEVTLRHTGKRGQEIVLSAYPGHEREVVIKYAGFKSIGQSHVVLHGFKFMHTPAYGIRFQGPEDSSEPPAENITISGNYTHDTYSSGISVSGIKWGRNPGNYNNIRDVIIENNLLELGTNGGRSEIITVANGAVNVHVRYNEIRLGDPSMKDGDEGIDFKEGVRDSKIYGNLIHDLSDKAIYIDGGTDSHNPQITNIEIFDNIIYDIPSAGIVITTEGKGDVDGIKVYNNVVHDVVGDGYIVYRHPGGKNAGGTVKNVQFINNTAYNTGTRHIGHGGFRVNHPTATGIVFRNNIGWNNNGYDIRGESETTYDHNLCREILCEVQANPQFVSGEFSLKSTSPAINAGSDKLAPSTDILGTPRPSGQVDLGAYQY